MLADMGHPRRVRTAPVGGRPEAHYVGLLRSTASWAKVARELLRALGSIGYTVSATEVVEDRFQPEFPLGGLEGVVGPPGRDYVGWTFSSPVDYPGLQPKAQIGLLVFEGTLWPPRWVEMARRHLARAVVPSQFCRETLAASGFPRRHIGVVPHGIDPAVYRPAGRATPGSRETLRLLFVGTPAWRKGLDVLLRAFERAFSPDDAVLLQIKAPLYPDESARPYLNSRWREQVRALEAKGYRVPVLTEVFAEAEMAELYRSADLLCQPFRAEGFGMPLLEAMACGTPVLATAWSGPLDFVDEAAGFLVREHRLVPGGSMLLGEAPSDPPSLVAEPDVDAVARALRHAAEDRRQMARRGEAAALRAGGWTWEEAARTLAASFADALPSALPDHEGDKP